MATAGSHLILVILEGSRLSSGKMLEACESAETLSGGARKRPGKDDDNDPGYHIENRKRKI